MDDTHDSLVCGLMVTVGAWQFATTTLNYCLIRRRRTLKMRLVAHGLSYTAFRGLTTRRCSVTRPSTRTWLTTHATLKTCNACLQLQLLGSRLCQQGRTHLRAVAQATDFRDPAPRYLTKDSLTTRTMTPRGGDKVPVDRTFCHKLAFIVHCSFDFTHACK